MIRIRRYWVADQRWAELILDGETVGHLRGGHRQRGRASAYVAISRHPRGYTSRATTGRTLSKCVAALRSETDHIARVCDLLRPPRDVEIEGVCA